MTTEKLNVDILGAALRASGCAAYGFAAAHEIPAEVAQAYDVWIQKDYVAGMDYLKEQSPLRRNPAYMLEGVRTVISIAFRFPKPAGRHHIAAYALGRDYHKAIKSRLKPVKQLIEAHAALARICVDSAPLPERYWAVKAGIAHIGCNGMALVNGCGPYAFLCEVLTDLDLTHCGSWSAVPAVDKCNRCHACVKACPAQALMPNGCIDCRKCLSYLSIEHKGEFPPLTAASDFPLLGCDRCLEACPLPSGRQAPVIDDFMPRRCLESLTPDRLLDMTDEALDALTAGTALRRPGIARLRRNALLALRSFKS